MTKLITIEYNEYLDLVEKAEMTKEKLDEMRFENINSVTIQCKKFEEAETKRTKRNIEYKCARLRNYINLLTNMFGYVKANKLNDYIDVLFKEEDE